MQTPKFDLDNVKKCIVDWRDGKESGWFSATSCSTDYVIHIFECNQLEAENIIFAGILKLEESNFSQRVSLWGEVADEYGLESYLGHNWYIKFMIGNEGDLEEISFHPCEKDMTLASGKNLTTSISEDNLPRWRKK